MEYKSKLLAKKEVAYATMAFYFERPDSFVFKSGQSLDLTLVNPPETDAKGNTRPFSIASAPHEEQLMIATRMRDSAFKRVLKNYEPGTEVSIAGPFGSMTLHEDTTRPAVFLAGGIGITPFRSIVLDAITRQVPHKMHLFYSNRRPEDSAFLQELIDLERVKDGYILIPTMTDMGNSKAEWTGRREKITAEFLKRELADVLSPIYYMAGPPGMVAGLHKVLNEAGVGDDNIRYEEFSGYE